MHKPIGTGVAHHFIPTERQVLDLYRAYNGMWYSWFRITRLISGTLVPINYVTKQISGIVEDALIGFYVEHYHEGQPVMVVEPNMEQHLIAALIRRIPHMHKEQKRPYAESLLHQLKEMLSDPEIDESLLVDGGTIRCTKNGLIEIRPNRLL